MFWAADVCSRAASTQPRLVSSISLGRFFSVSKNGENLLVLWSCKG